MKLDYWSSITLLAGHNPKQKNSSWHILLLPMIMLVTISFARVDARIKFGNWQAG